MTLIPFSKLTPLASFICDEVVAAGGGGLGERLRGMCGSLYTVIVDKFSSRRKHTDRV